MGVIDKKQGLRTEEAGKRRLDATLSSLLVAIA